MFESKFTSGPWRLLPPSAGVDANWHVTDAGDTFVAHVFGFAHSVTEQSRINATLIAAAPELYEALTKLTHAMDTLIHEGVDRGKGHWPAWDDCARAASTARAALLKATEEKPQP